MIDMLENTQASLSDEIHQRKGLVDVSLDDSAFDSPGKDFIETAPDAISVISVLSECQNFPSSEPLLKCLFEEEVKSTFFCPGKKAHVIDASSPVGAFRIAYKAKGFKDVLPFFALFVMLTSCIVLVSTVTFGFNREEMMLKDPASLNVKYQSIAFGSEKLQQRLKRDASNPEQQLDDEGNPLNGKRASIKFAHDAIMNANSKVNKAKVNDPDDSTQSSVSVKDELSSEVNREKREEDPFRRRPNKPKKGRKKSD